MRHVALATILAACGGGDSKTQDASGPQDAPGATVDAPPLTACTPVNGTAVKTRMVTQISGSAALLVTAPPNDGRLFVAMQDGRIMIIDNGQVRSTPFLDISNTNLASGGERGLLGLAFSPNYATDRAFYVMYTTTTADVVARFHASEADPYASDGKAGEIILSIPDFAPNHNGGMIEFGKDGYLYIATGDGGGGGDPRRTSQALTRTSQIEPLLGKMLRIDVNTTSGVKNYGIPDGNPYKNGGGEPEIYVLGLRNPWRWSFDRMTGDMWIGDVGQGGQGFPAGREEVTLLKANQIAGANLGWSMYEATNCFGNYTCNATGMTMPQIERPASAGWRSVIGGEVYRGTCYPDLVGTYIFADHFRASLWKATVSGDTVTASELPNPQGGFPSSMTSIHGDARGELFITTINGSIYQIEAGP